MENGGDSRTKIRSVWLRQLYRKYLITGTDILVLPHIPRYKVENPHIIGLASIGVEDKISLLLDIETKK